MYSSYYTPCVIANEAAFAIEEKLTLLYNLLENNFWLIKILRFCAAGTLRGMDMSGQTCG